MFMKPGTGTGFSKIAQLHKGMNTNQTILSEHLKHLFSKADSTTSCLKAGPSVKQSQ